MILADLLSPGHIISEMQSEEQLPAIKELVEHLVETGALAPSKRDSALAALYAREEKGSTGIGSGIAIPHSFLPELDEVTAIFGRSKKGIDFSAIDNAPVYFVVLFLVPKSQHMLHLKTLAVIAKLLNSAETRNRLSAAADEAELLEILSVKSNS